MNGLPVFDLGSLAEVKSTKFFVGRFAPYLQHHHQLKVPHGHSFYHLVLFTEGAGTHTIDFQQFPVRPWQIYFMVPGQVHNWSFDGHVEGYVLNFENDFFQSFLLRPDYIEQFPFFQADLSHSVLEVPDSLCVKVSQLFEEMLEVKLDQGNLSFDKVRIAMLQLFLLMNELISDRAEKGPAGFNLQMLRSFQKLINVHFRELRLPKEYAALLYVSPNHLNALCSEHLGISAGELIRKRVVLEAKRLLVNADLPISSIAWQLNFKDNSYFSRFFRKSVGVGPEEFRKQIFRSDSDNESNGNR